MKIHSIFARNYRPFTVLEEVQLGNLATIIGKNDTGKSSILQALKLFFATSPKIEITDVHDGATTDEDVVIEVSFTDIPDSFEIEEGIETTLQDEMLVDQDGYLRIRKTYPQNNLTKFNIALITNDFEDSRFSGLAVLKEKDLNTRCSKVGIDVSRSGRGITNKSKRETLRNKAQEERIQIRTCELALKTKDELWKKISSLLPEFVLFETDTKLGVGETTFQSQFRAIVKAAAEQAEVVEAKDAFTEAIRNALQSEVEQIFERLQRHTDVFVGLNAKPEFTWDKAVTFEIVGKDTHGVEISLDQRGSGIRRLLMVSFFQYITERGKGSTRNFIYAVEEPENCLHPGLQRELVASFRRLADEGYQIIISSHSPVFAGASPIEDLTLIVRESGVARSIQFPHLDLPDVAEQLGVEPSDQITGYNACIFVEGPTDIEFWKTIASKFKSAGHIDTDFDDKRVGFVLCGGESLKHWINLRAMKRLNRHFGVVVDSDRESTSHNIPGRKSNWKRKCEEEGGIFFILRKREIENYLHKDAIARSGRTVQPYDDFSDMKSLFGYEKPFW